jgi:hypothetical protein
MSNPSNEVFHSQYDKAQSSSKPRPTNPISSQSESRPTVPTLATRPTRHDKEPPPYKVYNKPRPTNSVSTQQSEIKQSMSQDPRYVGQGIVDSIMWLTGGPQPPKVKYQTLKEEYLQIRDELKQARATIENYDRELRRRNRELRQASQFIGHLQDESQRSKDSISGLQNELNDVHQQLEDAKTLSDVLGPQSTKPDTLSISGVGEKVTALNEEIPGCSYTRKVSYL